MPVWAGYAVKPYVDEKLTVIIMSNLSGNAELGAITHRIASIYDKKIKMVKEKEHDNGCVPLNINKVDN